MKTKKKMSPRKLGYTVLDMRFRQSMDFDVIAHKLGITLADAHELNRKYVDDYVKMINDNYQRIKSVCSPRYCFDESGWGWVGP